MIIKNQTQILTSCIKDNFNKRGCCGGNVEILGKGDGYVLLSKKDMS